MDQGTRRGEDRGGGGRPEGAEEGGERQVKGKDESEGEEGSARREGREASIPRHGMIVTAESQDEGYKREGRERVTLFRLGWLH